jgi:hypothetical protein
MTDPLANSFRLYSRENNVPAIGNNNGPGTSSVSNINQLSSLPGILFKTLHRCRVGVNDRYNSGGDNNVSKANINQMVVIVQKIFPPFLSTAKALVNSKGSGHLIYSMF